jgi:hypothetical protein
VEVAEEAMGSEHALVLSFTPRSSKQDHVSRACHKDHASYVWFEDSALNPSQAEQQDMVCARSILSKSKEFDQAIIYKINNMMGDVCVKREDKE